MRTIDVGHLNQKEHVFYYQALALNFDQILWSIKPDVQADFANEDDPSFKIVTTTGSSADMLTEIRFPLPVVGVKITTAADGVIADLTDRAVPIRSIKFKQPVPLPFGLRIHVAYKLDLNSFMHHKVGIDQPLIAPYGIGVPTFHYLNHPDQRIRDQLYQSSVPYAVDLAKEFEIA